MILDDILAQTAKAVAAAKVSVPLGTLEEQARGMSAPRPFVEALRGRHPVAAIAEFKRRSPSLGWIRQDAVADDVARAYERAGAAAMSVLTDAPFFGGSLDDLRAVRAAVSLPLLRKDFVIDPYQIVQARAAGADAVLLIVAALDDVALPALLREATRWDMAALVETHDAVEVRRAVAAGATLIGINHRDLRTFTLDMSLAIRMRREIPKDRLVVAESGLSTPGDVVNMSNAGIDAILVGERLMRAPDPGAALAHLLGGA